MKQTKAIKTLLYNQDLDNESIQLVKYSLRKTDINNMTLEEAKRIIEKMPQAKRDAANEILLDKVQPLQQYDIKEAGRKGILLIKYLIHLFWFMVIGGMYLCTLPYVAMATFICYLIYSLVIQTTFSSKC